MNFQSGQMIADKYILDGELGQGGIATVYKMHHIKLETPFALKILKISTASLKQRLELEAKVQAKIRHPNVVSVLDVIEEDGFLGLVMEFVEGVALDSFLLQERLNLEETEEIFLAILDAMEEAHDNAIVHRDLKPGNVMIQKKRGKFQVKVCDFGLAKALDDEGASNTVSGTTMGTPAYMAPEQVRNSKTVDQKADIFSLGAILYEMVSGKKAFTGTTTWEILSAVTEKQPPSITDLVPDIPERFLAAINGSLQKQATKRIPSCGELREVLLGRKAWTPSKSDSLIMDGFDLMSGEYTIETADLDGLALNGLEEQEKQEQKQAAPPKKSKNNADVSAQVTRPSLENQNPSQEKSSQPLSNETSVAPAQEMTSEEKSSSLPIIIAAIVLLILGGVGFAFMRQSSDTEKSTEPQKELADNSEKPTKSETKPEKPEEKTVAENKEPPKENTTVKVEEKPIEKNAVPLSKPPAEKETIAVVENKTKNKTVTVEKTTTPEKKLDAATTKEVVGKFDAQTRNNRRLQDCFASQQALSGTAPTHVPLIVTLENTGKVTSATISEGEYSGSTFETCLQTNLKSMSYEGFDPEAKPIKFKYTLKH